MVNFGGHFCNFFGGDGKWEKWGKLCNTMQYFPIKKCSEVGENKNRAVQPGLKGSGKPEVFNTPVPPAYFVVKLFNHNDIENQHFSDIQNETKKSLNINFPRWQNTGTTSLWQKKIVGSDIYKFLLLIMCLKMCCTEKYFP